MESQPNRILINGLTWLSSKVKNLIGKSQQLIIIPQQTYQKANSSLSKKPKQQLKETILMKLRKPSSQNRFNVRLQKIKQFMEQKVQYQKPLQLVCPICIDMFVRPAVTVCGHTFCYRCLDQALLFNPVCPVCRTFIRGYDLTICKSFNQIILRYLQKYDDESYCKAYQQKLKDFQIWITNRNINSLQIKINDVIDARDTEFIWCKAVVRQVYRKNKKVTGVLIHYLGWNQVYDQIIEIDSQRLASLNVYSARVDIPHYHLNQEVDDNMYSYVVIGQPLQPLPNLLQENIERMPNFDDYNQVDLVDPIMQDQMGQRPFENNQDSSMQSDGSNQQGHNYINYFPLDYMMLHSDDDDGNDSEEVQRQNNQQNLNERVQKQRQNPQENRHSLLREYLQIYKLEKERQKDIQVENQKFLDVIMSINCDKIQALKEQQALTEEQAEEQPTENENQNFETQYDTFKMKIEQQYSLRAKSRALELEVHQEEKEDKQFDKHQCTVKQYEIKTHEQLPQE